MTGVLSATCVILALSITAYSHAKLEDAAENKTTTTIQTGVASFDAREFAGRQAASGEPLKTNAMTAASRTLPIGTRVQVLNMETGRSASVRINDRGPYANGRVLDLTPGAAQQIGLAEDDGLAQVAIRTISQNLQAPAREQAAADQSPKDEIRSPTENDEIQKATFSTAYAFPESGRSFTNTAPPTHPIRRTCRIVGSPVR